jgi:hypothetical protein
MASTPNAPASGAGALSPRLDFNSHGIAPVIARLAAARFPIRRIEPVADFQGSDNRSRFSVNGR